MPETDNPFTDVLSRPDGETAPRPAIPGTAAPAPSPSPAEAGALGHRRLRPGHAPRPGYDLLARGPVSRQALQTSVAIQPGGEHSVSRFGKPADRAIASSTARGPIRPSETAGDGSVSDSDVGESFHGSLTSV